MLPMFRVGALLTTMPVFGTTLVPKRIKLFLSLAITLAIMPSLPPLPTVNPLDLSGLLLIAEQIIIGALLGLSLQLFFQAFVVAGQIVAIQMGMGFASMVDPANGVNVAVIGQFFTMLVTLLFLSMNGHLVVFEVLTESFTTLPVGGIADQPLLGNCQQTGLGAGRRVAAGAAGHYRAAGGQYCLWRDDPGRAATEHLRHRFSTDPGAGHGDPVDQHGGHSQPVSTAGLRGPAVFTRTGTGEVERYGREREWRR
jgi:hypothetical protein